MLNESPSENALSREKRRSGHVSWHGEQRPKSTRPRYEKPPQAGGFIISQHGGTPSDVFFAANLVEPIESAIEPKRELLVDTRKGGEVAGFHVGVRREIWIYLLLAAALLTALEWGTYHRRLTV